MSKHTVLLTGGSRGIGEAILKLLKSKGYIVIAPKRAELDLANNHSIDKFVKKYSNKKIDILINNAGVNNPAWIEELKDENLSETIQINLVTPIRLTRGFITSMKKRGWGRIVNISSIFGVVARGKQIPYSVSKHGLNGFTKALALELASYDILVNSVCPGFTRTNLMTQRNTPEKIKLFEKDIPIGRLAEPKEIANLVEFLISEKNTYITGTNIVIDGGFTCK